VAALAGKAIACWVAGALLGFSRPQRAAMYVLTAPQAAATLAVTLIGFEIGLFGTTVVNAVLVLILVSIVFSALLTDKVVQWLPRATGITPRLGSRVLVVAPGSGPSDAAVQAATLLARPDGGHADLVLAGGPPPDSTALRLLEGRIARHGFEGHVHVDVDDIGAVVAKALRRAEHSVLIVDDPAFPAAIEPVPLLVVGEDGAIVFPDGANGDVRSRLARGRKAVPV
jgi:hypothetical protein